MSDRPSLLALDAPTDAYRALGPRGPAAARPLETPTFLDTARASYRLAQADRSGDDEQAVIDAYGPLVSELSDHGRSTSRYVLAARGAGRPINEDSLWADIAEIRRTDPTAFKGVAKTRDQFRADVLARYRQDLARAEDVSSRGSTLGNLAGGFAGSLTDPVNIGTMWIGGGGGTIARRIASEALANAGVELAQQPLVAEQRAKTDRELTTAEAVTNVAIGGLAGGAFAGAAIGGKALASRARTPAGELARSMRERIGWRRMTDAEQAAVRTLEREDEIVASSPFQPGPSTERYAAQVDALVEAATAPDAGTSRLDALIPLSAPARPRPVSTADASARIAADPWEQFKAQVRRAESGGNDQARNPRSSATGRYQVIDSTWLRVTRALPGAEGMTDAGLLGMRTHPVWQEKVMDVLGRDYRAALARAGAAETPGNLYLMHFAGTGGGSKILRADGDTPIEEILSAGAIDANPFLRGKSADEVIDWAHRAMRAERSNAPVLRRDVFPEDDAGDAAWRAAQREVETADRDWADWTREEGPPRVADEWGVDDIPFDLDDARARPSQAADPFGEPADMVQATVPADAATDAVLSPISVRERGEPGYHLEPDADGHMVNAVFRDADGRARGAVIFPASAEVRAFRRESGQPVDVVAYVDPAFRRQGVATRLYDELRDGGYDVDALSGMSDLTPDGAAFVNARRARNRAVPPGAPDALEPMTATPDMDRYWSDGAADGRAIEPLFAVRSAEGGDLVWWTPSRHQAQRLLREEPGRYAMERIDPPDTVIPSQRSVMLAAFDDPDGDGVGRQIDSLEHDLRMFLQEDEAAGLTVRLDDEGDVISAADLLDDLDQDEAAIAAARACMVPPGKEAA